MVKNKNSKALDKKVENQERTMEEEIYINKEVAYYGALNNSYFTSCENETRAIFNLSVGAIGFFISFLSFTNYDLSSNLINIGFIIVIIAFLVLIGMCFITWAANKEHALLLISECNLSSEDVTDRAVVACEIKISKKSLQRVDKITKYLFILALFGGVLFSALIINELTKKRESEKMSEEKKSNNQIAGKLITDSVEKAGVNRPTPPKKDNKNNKED